MSQKQRMMSRRTIYDVTPLHIALVGCTKELFTEGALDQIFMASGGILREINNIATECLIKSANQSLQKVDERFAKMVIDQRETN